MRILIVTRKGIQADHLVRAIRIFRGAELPRGLLVKPISAAFTGERYDRILVTFRPEDPIPGEDDSPILKRSADRQRQCERLALKESIPTKLRHVDYSCLSFVPLEALTMLFAAE